MEENVTRSTYEDGQSHAPVDLVLLRQMWKKSKLEQKEEKIEARKLRYV